jgi:hypothetical protein
VASDSRRGEAIPLSLDWLEAGVLRVQAAGAGPLGSAAVLPWGCSGPPSCLAAPGSGAAACCQARAGPCTRLRAQLDSHTAASCSHQESAHQTPQLRRMLT